MSRTTNANKIDLNNLNLDEMDKEGLKAVLHELDTVDKQIAAIAKKATGLKELKKKSDTIEAAVHTRLAEIMNSK